MSFKNYILNEEGWTPDTEGIAVVQHHLQYYTFTWFLHWSHLLTHLLAVLLDTVISYIICQPLNSPAVIYKSMRNVNTILLVSFNWIRGYLWIQTQCLPMCFSSLLHLCFSREQLANVRTSHFDSFWFKFIGCSDTTGLSGGFVSTLCDECTIYFWFMEMLMQRNKES